MPIRVLDLGSIISTIFQHLCHNVSAKISINIVLLKFFQPSILADINKSLTHLGTSHPVKQLIHQLTKNLQAWN